MVYIMNKSDGESQQGGHLYKPNRGIKYSWVSDRPQKSRPVNFSQWYCGNLLYLLVEVSIGNENILLHSVIFSVHMWWVLANPVSYFKGTGEIFMDLWI